MLAATATPAVVPPCLTKPLSNAHIGLRTTAVPLGASKSISSPTSATANAAAAPAGTGESVSLFHRARRCRQQPHTGRHKRARSHVRRGSRSFVSARLEIVWTERTSSFCRQCTWLPSHFLPESHAAGSNDSDTGCNLPIRPRADPESDDAQHRELVPALVSTRSRSRANFRPVSERVSAETRLDVHAALEQWAVGHSGAKGKSRAEWRKWKDVSFCSAGIALEFSPVIAQYRPESTR